MQPGLSGVAFLAFGCEVCSAILVWMYIGRGIHKVQRAVIVDDNQPLPRPKCVTWLIIQHIWQPVKLIRIYEMRKRRRYSISPLANTPIACTGRASSAATCMMDWAICWTFVCEDDTWCGGMTTECLMIYATRCICERGERRRNRVLHHSDWEVRVFPGQSRPPCQTTASINIPSRYQSLISKTSPIVSSSDQANITTSSQIINFR